MYKGEGYVRKKRRGELTLFKRKAPSPERVMSTIRRNRENRKKERKLHLSRK